MTTCPVLIQIDKAVLGILCSIVNDTCITDKVMDDLIVFNRNLIPHVADSLLRLINLHPAACDRVQAWYQQSRSRIELTQQMLGCMGGKLNTIDMLCNIVHVLALIITL